MTAREQRHVSALLLAVGEPVRGVDCRSPRFVDQAHHRLPDAVWHVLCVPVERLDLGRIADTAGIVGVHRDRPDQAKLRQCRGIEGGSDAFEALEGAEFQPGKSAQAGQAGKNRHLRESLEAEELQGHEVTDR